MCNIRSDTVCSVICSCWFQNCFPSLFNNCMPFWSHPTSLTNQINISVRTAQCKTRDEATLTHWKGCSLSPQTRSSYSLEEGSAETATNYYQLWFTKDLVTTSSVTQTYNRVFFIFLKLHICRLHCLISYCQLSKMRWPPCFLCEGFHTNISILWQFHYFLSLISSLVK